MNEFGKEALIVGAFISVGILVLNWNKISQDSDGDTFTPLVNEVIGLAGTAISSSHKKHAGKVIIIDVNEKVISKYHTAELGLFTSGTEITYDLPKTMIAATPDEAKTIVFLKENAPVLTSKYCGSVSISTANSQESMSNDPLFSCYKNNNNCINIYAASTELEFFDLETKELLTTERITSLDKKPLPKDISCCLKVVSNYTFGRDHSGPLYAPPNSSDCGLFFDYFPKHKTEQIWDTIKSTSG